MNISFPRIWSMKHSELKNWLFYNVFIALLPVLFSWLCLAIGGVFSHFFTPFLDGTLLIFTATLSGASMSFFVAETKRNLWKTERLILKGLLTAIVLGVAGYCTIITLTEFSPCRLSPPIVFLITCATMAVAIYFNLYLAGIQSVYTDDNLMDKLVAEEVKGVIEQKAALADQAQTADEVDGAKL